MARVASEVEGCLAGGRIPHFHCSVITRAGQPIAVGAKRYAPDLVSVRSADGENFLTVGYEGDYPAVKTEPYYEEGSGCFQPFLLVDEGQMIEPFGKSGWDAHYGKTLEL